MPHAAAAGETDLPPVPLVRIRPPTGWVSFGFGELWAYRELFYFLAWRDIKVRYKQTAFGVAWVVLQPVLTMLVFAMFFGKVMKIPSDGVPYALFAYAGLLPWLFFSKAVTQASASVVGSANLITKVYFPRLVIPAAAVAAGLVDWAIGFLAFVPLMAIYGVVPAKSVMLLPLFALLTALLALGTAFCLSSVNVKYRDIGAIVPLGLQLWMFATPIIYPTSLLPERWRTWLLLNPLAGITEGIRAAIFGLPFDNRGLAAAAVGAVVVFGAGVVIFRRLEDQFADVV
jgi:lipopolysaccharide transport system permease protein